MSHLIDDATTALAQVRAQVHDQILGSSVILKAVAQRVESTTQIQLTEAQTRQLLEQEPAMIRRLFEYGMGDSLIRDKLADLMAQHLLDRSWPLYRDEDDIDGFYAQLHAAARRRGYLVLERV